jgi:hypothetical protein
MINRVYVRGYKGAGFGSGFIKWFTFGEYSHVSFVFEHDSGMREEVESIQGKGVIAHIPHLTNKEYTDRKAPLAPWQMQRLYEIVTGLVGADYDWSGIYGFLVRKKRQALDKWFCSELVAYGLEQVGYPLSRRKPYQETPQTVMDNYRLV